MHFDKTRVRYLVGNEIDFHQNDNINTLQEWSRIKTVVFSQYLMLLKRFETMTMEIGTEHNFEKK